MAKVRLVKGPFAGKVMDVKGPAGQTDIFITAPKPMSRRERYEWQRSVIVNQTYPPFPTLLSKDMDSHPHFPRVRAEYRIVMRPHYGQGGMHVVACQHPDGSFFYEYVPDSKKEY